MDGIEIKIKLCRSENGDLICRISRMVECFLKKQNIPFEKVDVRAKFGDE